jgi:23S rRNA pseudouridine1911/1915/1917 synthase
MAEATFKAPCTVPSEHAEKTLAALLRALLPGQSWSDVRRLIETRRAKLNDELCLDPARRVHEGEVIEVLPGAAPLPPERVAIRHLDEHVVVVEKPSGMNTVRHPSERHWTPHRKSMSPTLEDIVPRLIVRQEGRFRKGPPPRLRVVQRLDKETSGLIVFARTVAAERGLGKQFHAHTVHRRYLAVVRGYLAGQTIRSRLVRDRGDGRRGSTAVADQGKEAVTHVEPVERLPGYMLVACRLETGRTHQIRIHLAELSHAVCGEKVYGSRADDSGAPRLALHAAELGFRHPATGEEMRWEMPLPPDLAEFVGRLREGKTGR